MCFITCNFYTTDPPEGSAPSGADLRPALLGYAPPARLPVAQPAPGGAPRHAAQRSAGTGFVKTEGVRLPGRATRRTAGISQHCSVLQWRQVHAFFRHNATERLTDYRTM